MEDWYNQYMLMDMVTAAKRLGMNIQAKRMGPCPACKAEKGYSKKDDRPPLRIFKIRGTERWKCSACDATGNIFDLVSLSLYEVFAGDLPQFSQLKAWIGSNTTRKTSMLSPMSKFQNTRRLKKSEI